VDGCCSIRLEEYGCKKDGEQELWTEQNGNVVREAKAKFKGPYF
jgi:hypothetical protein